MSTIYFSQIREDSLVERTITSKFAPERIAIIGSGGCTAFSVLDDQLKQVYCIDHNPAQCALIELKKAAIRELDRECYLGFIGEWPYTIRNDIYENLAPQLPYYARDFWDRNRELIDVGINKCGINEKFYRFIGENVCNSLYDKEIWNQLFSTTSLEEQHSFVNKYLSSPVWKTAIKILLSKTTHLQFFPAFMFENANEHDFGQFFLAQFEKEMKEKRVTNNYFISQLLFSSYLYNQKEGTPYYLTEEGFKRAKRNIAKLSVHPVSIQSFLKEAEVIDAFYLSNIFDWASTEETIQICKAILAAKSKDAMVLFRNMLSVSKLPNFFQEQFVINRELSEECLRLERSMLYQKLTLGCLK
jgi:S-adenosylmethionine:diacylglycerol 3-amino-3-carboxypropyl transferase